MHGLSDLTAHIQRSSLRDLVRFLRDLLLGLKSANTEVGGTERH